VHSNFGNPYHLFIVSVQLLMGCCSTPSDLWKAYSGVLPSKRHRAVGKETGETNHLERFNNTLRQRISRLGRKTLSFSKKHSHHLAAIWYFIHHYNSNLSS